MSLSITFIGKNTHTFKSNNSDQVCIDLTNLPSIAFTGASLQTRQGLVQFNDYDLGERQSNLAFFNLDSIRETNDFYPPQFTEELDSFWMVMKNSLRKKRSARMIIAYVGKNDDDSYTVDVRVYKLYFERLKTMAWLSVQTFHSDDAVLKNYVAF